MVISAFGIAALVGRIIFSIVMQHPKVNAIVLYTITLFSMGTYIYYFTVIDNYYFQVRILGRRQPPPPSTLNFVAHKLMHSELQSLFVAPLQNLRICTCIYA